MEIDVKQYLSEDEIKEIAKDEVRNVIRKHFNSEEDAKRILCNASYQIMFDEIDKIVPNSRDIIKEKTIQLINKSSKEYDYKVFHDGGYGGKSTLAYQYIQEAVKENKDIFKEKIKQTMIDKDLDNEVWDMFEKLGEDFTHNIYNLVELARNKKPEES